MLSKRGQSLRVLMILLLIAGAVTLQAVSILPDHPSDHARHCCAFCHLAHVPLVNPAQLPGLLAPDLTAWFTPSEELSTGRETLVVVRQPRAPPLQGIVSL